MMPSYHTPALPDRSKFDFRDKSQGISMSSEKLPRVKRIVVKLKSLFTSPKKIFRRRSSSSFENTPNQYNILSGYSEVSEKVLLETEAGTPRDCCVFKCRTDYTGSELVEATVGETPRISCEVSQSREGKVSNLEVCGNFSEIAENILTAPFYRITCSMNQGSAIKRVNRNSFELPMAHQNLSLISPNLHEPKIARLHGDATTSTHHSLSPAAEPNSNEPRGPKKMRRRRKEAVHKLKSGFLVATNHIAERISTCMDVAEVNVDEPFTCKKTFKKCRSKEFSKSSKDFRSTPKRAQENLIDEKSNSVHLERQRQDKNGVECHAKKLVDQSSNQNPPISMKSKLPNPILDYTFLSMDYFYTVIEQLHDHMDLVRNGVQQLIDNFTQPSTMRLQEQETRMLQFKQSVEMLLQSIERMNYAMINLPHKISNMRYLLLPCKNTIREFNDHLQKMSIDLEHTQYFNNDSPMHTLLKMIVIIKILNAVMGRGRRSFIRSVDLPCNGSEENGIDFDVCCYHERFIRPTFDMLFRRTEAMVKLRNFSVVLSQRWVDSQDWSSFLPSLQEFMKLIKMVEPYLAVPQDWYAVRILPETRIMHVFDGFMSEFYRAIVTPGFANANPVAFGSIFTVIQFILDNIINQHVIILRDLNTGLNLQKCEPIEGRAAESVDCMDNNSHGVRRQNSPLYENVDFFSNAVNDDLDTRYQNI